MFTSCSFLSVFTWGIFYVCKHHMKNMKPSDLRPSPSEFADTIRTVIGEAEPLPSPMRPNPIQNHTLNSYTRLDLRSHSALHGSFAVRELGGDDHAVVAAPSGIIQGGLLLTARASGAASPPPGRHRHSILPAHLHRMIIVKELREKKKKRSAIVQILYARKYRKVQHTCSSKKQNEQRYKREHKILHSLRAELQLHFCGFVLGLSFKPKRCGHSGYPYFDGGG